MITGPAELPPKKVILITGGPGVGKSTAASYIESAFGYPTTHASLVAEQAYCSTFVARSSDLEYGTRDHERFQVFQGILRETFGHDLWVKNLDKRGLLVSYPGITVVDNVGDNREAFYDTCEVVAEFRIIRGELPEGDLDTHVTFINNPCPWPHSNKRAFFEPFMDNVLDAVATALDVERPPTPTTQAIP